MPQYWVRLDLNTHIVNDANGVPPEGYGDRILGGFANNGDNLYVALDTSWHIQDPLVH
jgi:hypothetical protein